MKTLKLENLARDHQLPADPWSKPYPKSNNFTKKKLHVFKAVKCFTTISATRPANTLKPSLQKITLILV